MAESYPDRIILLRHGEKKNADELCSVGQLRAAALAAQYLGKDAPENAALFGPDRKPDAFFAITDHTRETASPSAQSWGQQLTVFEVPPHDPNEDPDLTTQTKSAAAALNSGEYEGKIVVVVWEHKHIANSALNDSGATLWSLLDLGAIGAAAVPAATWNGLNYDFFWIVDYTTAPPTFTSVPQHYAGDQYSEVPDNAWGVAVDPAKFPKFYQHCKQDQQQPASAA